MRPRTVCCGACRAAGRLRQAAGRQPYRCLGSRSRAAQGIARAMRSRRAGHGRGRLSRRREAFRRRFVSGGAGLDEHQTLADLPSIPPSFKEPADGVAPAFPAEPEGTP